MYKHIKNFFFFFNFVRAKAAHGGGVGVRILRFMDAAVFKK